MEDKREEAGDDEGEVQGIDEETWVRFCDPAHQDEQGL